MIAGRFEIATPVSEMGEAVERALYAWARDHSDATIDLRVGSEERSEGINATIAHVQAAYERNPWYLRPDELGMIKDALRKVFTGQHGATFAQVGNMLKVFVLAHIEEQRNKRGPFRALTEAYAKTKQRRFGFTVPILRATGELMDSLRVEIHRRRS